MKLYKNTEYYTAKLNELIADAQQNGFVLKIDVVSQQPLSMGNVMMVPDVRPSRQRYNSVDKSE